MFYRVMNSSGGAVSKSDILRGIITEKLSTAAREILAVVERTVADYEEEASGFRREIDRQRRQLELLQPQVKLERRDLNIHEVMVVMHDKDEQQHTDVENSDALDILWYGDNNEDVDEDVDKDDDEDVDNDDSEEGELLSTKLATRSRSKGDDLKDPDYQISPRKKPNRGNFLHFRICLLEDSQTNDGVTKSPVQELKCPRDCSESDFVNLLRTSFPQLDRDRRPVMVFRSDPDRGLCRLETLRLDHIVQTVAAAGGQDQTIYIRIRRDEEGDDVPVLPNDGPQLTNPVEIKSEEEKPQLSPAKGEDAVASTSQDVTMSEVDSGDGEDGDSVAARDGGGSPKPPQKQPLKRRRKKKLISWRSERSKTPCKVCGVWYSLLGCLIKHAWSHTATDPPSVCGVCGQSFDSADGLKEHLQGYQKTHNCSLCGRSFFTVTGLDRHTFRHTGVRPFKCGTCGKTFAKEYSLTVHRWVHVEDRPYKCDICPKSFGLQVQLANHRKGHTSTERYHCNICGKSLSHSRSMTRHKLTHMEERPYGCDVCGKRFKIPSVLKSHKKIHTERERSYLCHVCCKTFMHQSVLNTHMKSHSGERPHACAVCGKRFILKGALTAHMRMHTGETPYECGECGRLFKHKSHLNDHIRSHLGIKQYVCELCGKACSRQGQLKKHMRTHNGEKPYQCSVCSRSFTQSSSLKAHLKIHQSQDDPPPSLSTS
ncbi:uncharacterized protein KZ484_011500 [Pholidichthys leucotaenia]